MTKMIVNNADSRLVLGTAQIGMPYGVANINGQPNGVVALSIVETAWVNGIRYFDTAQGYGNAEIILGGILADLNITNEAKVISKFFPDIEHSSKLDIKNLVKASLKHLKISRLHGIMLHEENLIYHLNGRLGEALNELVDEGVVESVGVSTYTPKIALMALRSSMISMVQIPANILDSRMKDAGVVELADRLGKALFIRSVFLQGLLLMEEKNIPLSMLFSKEIVLEFASYADRLGMTRQQLALGFVKIRYPNARVIFGAETAGQVADNCMWWKKPPTDDSVKTLAQVFSNIDKKIINPTMWPL